MKTLALLFFICAILLANSVKSQTTALKAELIKESNQFFKTLPDGQIEFSFYLQGIQSEIQAQNLEKYIRAYRGVEEFNMSFDSQKNKYKAIGTFYNQANWSYFKYMFKIIKVEEVFKDNQWKPLEQINNL